MEFLTILPNLSIGVISILALVYISKQFLEQMRINDREMRKEVLEREYAFRELEAEVRKNIMTQLNENTIAFKRVIDHINDKK